MSKTAPTKGYVAYSHFLRAFFMGLNCLYIINWLLSTFCLFVWRCLANLKKLGCNSARSTLGIPSGASGRCRSSRLPDVMPFSRGGQGSDRWASAWLLPTGRCARSSSVWETLMSGLFGRGAQRPLGALGRPSVLRAFRRASFLGLDNCCKHRYDFYFGLQICCSLHSI